MDMGLNGTLEDDDRQLWNLGKNLFADVGSYQLLQCSATGLAGTLTRIAPLPAGRSLGSQLSHSRRRTSPSGLQELLPVASGHTTTT